MRTKSLLALPCRLDAKRRDLDQMEIMAGQVRQRSIGQRNGVCRIHSDDHIRPNLS